MAACALSWEVYSRQLIIICALVPPQGFCRLAEANAFEKKKVYDIFLVKKMLYSLGIYVSWSSGVSRSERMTDGTTFAETNCPGLPLFFLFFLNLARRKIIIPSVVVSVVVIAFHVFFFHSFFFGVCVFRDVKTSL